MLVQRALVDNRASGHIYQNGCWLHQGEFTPADQPAGGQRQGQRDDEHIRDREHPVQVRQGDRQLGRFAGAATAVHGIDAGTERCHHARCRDADAAQAKNDAGRAVQRQRRCPFVVPPRGERGMALRQALGDAKRHRQHVLRYRPGVGAGVAGHYQPVWEGREVDGVDTSRKQLDETEP